MLQVPHVLCFHDLCCAGRCSLTIVMPVLNSLGIQASALPGMLLSTHPKDFVPPPLLQLHDFARRTRRHFNAEGITFDAVFTGYLGGIDQIELAMLALKEHPKALHFVDPVMGDHGKFYTGFDESYAKSMRVLCSKAQIITPNLTEAAALLGLELTDRPLRLLETRNLMLLMHQTFPHCQTIVLTGITLTDGRHVNVVHHKDEVTFHFYGKAEGRYHGTGDMFSAVLCGCLLRGLNIYESVQLAAQHVTCCILHTQTLKTPARMGLVFEPLLYQLGSKVDRVCKSKEPILF